ncbi:hypothetical protein RISK_004075 [Rhodopirellula islandica]|uniref:Uncharacterized protein n=1 Tax=Rhodopirellula islandica TaxID=595434 RepID=A0A0J1BAV8_RHOIS|nr:hypothetical protein RISK_004075 [Rhodopirellula islandica]
MFIAGSPTVVASPLTSNLSNAPTSVVGEIHRSVRTNEVFNRYCIVRNSSWRKW